MLKTNTEYHSYHALRVWITNDEVRNEVRQWFEDYLFHASRQPLRLLCCYRPDYAEAGEIEISHDKFMETLDNADLNELSHPALTTIGRLLERVEHNSRDIACVIFAKRECDVEHPDE